VESNFEAYYYSVSQTHDFLRSRASRDLRSENHIKHCRSFPDYVSFEASLTSRCREQSDPVLQTNMQILGRIIAERRQACIELGIHEEQALAIEEAHESLCAWLVSCAEQPRRWDQYCAWPSCLTPEFFNAIADRNEIALLLLIYWCALMYRAPQPSVHLWAYRTAQYLLSKHPNRDIWRDLLSWPLDLLSKPRKTPHIGPVLGPT
jgi:hypothetical protein